MLFGMRGHDRLSHTYILGKTGTGKSTLLETMVRQDIVTGRGLALIDPHGDLAARLEQWASPLYPRLITIDLGDPNEPIGYNPLLRVGPQYRSLVTSGVIDLFKLLWSDAWGVRMEHILRNAILALLEQPSASLADLSPLLSEAAFRRGIIARIENPQVRDFWTKEFPRYSPRYQADGIAPIQNKLGAFLADPRLRRFLTPSDGGLRLRTLMDEGSVLLVNLAQGKVGSDGARLLGGLLVTALGSAAFSRASQPEETRRPFFIYVDEFQSFTTLAVANMLSELRKYRVGMILAHQYLGQLMPEIGQAVMGNAGTLVAFRLSAQDAGILAAELQPVFRGSDLVSLPNFEVCVRLIVDGEPRRPFSAATLSPEELAQLIGRII